MISRLRNRCGYTLVELMVAISLSGIVLGAVYFSLSAAMESWRYSKDELALQKVLGRSMETVLEGTDWEPGLRSAIEVTEAWPNRIRFIETAVEVRPVLSPNGAIKLSADIKAGTGLPTVEYRPTRAAPYQPIEITWENPDAMTQNPVIRPIADLRIGGQLRISYHADPDVIPQSQIEIYWDPSDKRLLHIWQGQLYEIAKNPFGVEIIDCYFRYYDQNNHLLPTDSDGRILDPESLQLITAVEIHLTGEVGGRELSLVGMMMLRNSARHSGIILLKPDLKISIPDSERIKTFSLANLQGLSHGDQIQFEITAPKSPGYKVTLTYEDFGKVRPLLGSIVVESPPGHTIYSEEPRTQAIDNLDFLTLGPNGFYDYDDDPEIDTDVVITGDPVILHVTRMDARGAALIVRP